MQVYKRHFCTFNLSLYFCKPNGATPRLKKTGLRIYPLLKCHFFVVFRKGRGKENFLEHPFRKRRKGESWMTKLRLKGKTRPVLDRFHDMLKNDVKMCQILRKWAKWWQSELNDDKVCSLLRKCVKCWKLMHNIEHVLIANYRHFDIAVW